jgi:hypothetical protein
MLETCSSCADSCSLNFHSDACTNSPAAGGRVRAWANGSGSTGRRGQQLRCTATGSGSTRSHPLLAVRQLAAKVSCAASPVARSRDLNSRFRATLLTSRRTDNRSPNDGFQSAADVADLRRSATKSLERLRDRYRRKRRRRAFERKSVSCSRRRIHPRVRPEGQPAGVRPLPRLLQLIGARLMCAILGLARHGCPEWPSRHRRARSRHSLILAGSSHDLAC